MIKSPCIDVCNMDRKNEFCTGCLRTIEEIGNWSKYSEQEKSKILDLIEKRNKPPMIILLIYKFKKPLKKTVYTKI